MIRKKKVNSIGKVRVYKTPTKASPNKSIVSIPQSIQLNDNIKSLAISQTEVLPPPKSVSDLFRVPKRTSDTPIGGFKSVQETNLTPGFTPEIVPIGTIKDAIPPLEIETIVVPDGYVHLEDISEYQKFSYNMAYMRTTTTFGALPGEENIARIPRYRVNVIGQDITVQINEVADSVRVYYRRKKADGVPNHWVHWATMTTEIRTFDKPGKYDLIAVPYLENKPLPFYREFSIENEESFGLKWSHVQLRDNEYQIRMEGVLGDRINHVQVLDNGKIIHQQRLRVNPMGETVAIFNIAFVALEHTIDLEFRFLNVYKGIERYISNSSYSFKRNYAKESIDFNVQESDQEGVYKITILDPDGILYSPTSEIDCFTGAEWDRAIQTQKMICKLEIVRHQEGDTTNYGNYFCNVSDGSKPVFLQSPPFRPTITKVSGGYSFEFEDTQAFRDVANVDNPISSKQIAYEFRLVLWTTGIEQVLRSGLDYNYIIEQPVIIRGEKTTYKRNHSVWNIEHPMVRYKKVVPTNPKYSYLERHIRYGRTMKGYILEGIIPSSEYTRHIHVGSPTWTVLYYLDLDKDSMAEHPMCTFNIDIPFTSEPNVKTISVSIDMEDEQNVLLGTWKASESITVVDFMGYFLKRKQFTQRVDISGPMGTARKNAVGEPRQRYSERRTRNTSRKRKLATEAVIQLNKEIDNKIEGGIIKYVIETQYIDGSTTNQFLNVNIANRPRMPEEPEDNIAFGPGNATLNEEFFGDVEIESFPTISSVIRQTEPVMTGRLRGPRRQ